MVPARIQSGSMELHKTHTKPTYGGTEHFNTNQKKHGMVQNASKIDGFLQDWSPSAKLPVAVYPVHDPL